MKKDKKEVGDFFKMLGEIWRDISAIEFLARCALARKAGDISKLPKPPYKKGKKYTEYPKSFSSGSFTNVMGRFNKAFPDIAVPKELIDFRHAMAHGLVAKIGNSDVNELVKFKKQDDDSLEVEFSITLEPERLDKIRKSLQKIRRDVAKKVAD